MCSITTRYKPTCEQGSCLTTTMTGSCAMVCTHPLASASARQDHAMTHLGLKQHAGSMVPGFLSLLYQCLLSMHFWIKVIHQDLSSVLQGISLTRRLVDHAVCITVWCMVSQHSSCRTYYCVPACFIQASQWKGNGINLVCLDCFIYRAEARR